MEANNDHVYPNTLRIPMASLKAGDYVVLPDAFGGDPQFDDSLSSFIHELLDLPHPVKRRAPYIVCAAIHAADEHSSRKVTSITIQRANFGKPNPLTLEPNSWVQQMASHMVFGHTDDYPMVRICFLKMFTVKLIGVGNDGKSFEVLQSKQRGTMHQVMKMELPEEENESQDRNLNPDFWFREGVVENIRNFYKLKLADTKTLLDKHHLPPPPIYKHCVRHVNKKPQWKFNYADGVASLQDGISSTLLALPDELLLVVMQWLEPEAQVKLRNTSQKLRAKVPRPIILNVSEMMVLYDIQSAMMLV